METVVRMGEAAASKAPGDVLACIGLGSCIGLALVDRAAGVAALAHVMLPESSQPDPPQLAQHRCSSDRHLLRLRPICFSDTE